MPVTVEFITEIDTASRASTCVEVTIGRDNGDKTVEHIPHTSRITFEFRRAGHRQDAKDFAAALEKDGYSTGARAVRALARIAFDALVTTPPCLGFVDDLLALDEG